MQKVIITVAIFCWSCLCFSQTNPTGLVFLSKSKYESVPLANTFTKPGANKNLIIDLSSKFPTPGSQGTTQGSCVGWAAAYLKSFNQNLETGTTDYFFSPSFIYNQIKLGGCEDGSYTVDALSLLVSRGNVLEKAFPYDPNNCTLLPTSKQINDASTYTSLSYFRIDLDIENLKRHLANSFPIIISITVDNSFQTYSGGIFSKWNNIKPGGHAMVIVGYDETKKAFKLINSWGTWWGENGFCWLSYTAFQQNTREAYIFYNKKNGCNRDQINSTVYGAIPVYRWYNPTRDNHFWTTDINGEFATNGGYHCLGIAFHIHQYQGDRMMPLYRWYDTKLDTHFYTPSKEGEVIDKNRFAYETIVGYVFKDPGVGKVPIYRYYDKKLDFHFYTVAPEEENLKDTSRWNKEDIMGYVYR